LTPLEIEGNFIIDGLGETSKKYLYKAILKYLRSKYIKTIARKQLGPTLKNSQALHKTALVIIWDKAPMASRFEKKLLIREFNTVCVVIWR
jgi:hypothetical protein